MKLDAEDLETLARLEATGVPVVVVLVSGRPVNVTAELPKRAALVEAWLPGSEGQGVADVLFGAYKPTGTLPVSNRITKGDTVPGGMKACERLT